MIAKYSLYISLLQCTLFSVLFAAETDGQHQKSVFKVFVNLNVDSTTLRTAFNEIESATKYQFNYHEKDLNLDQIVTLDKGKQSLGSILLQLSAQANLKFEKVNSQIAVVKRDEIETPKTTLIPLVVQNKKITGQVVSAEENSPLPGVSIVLKGTSIGTVTDADGKFSLEVPEKGVLTISFVGYLTEEVELAGQTTLNIALVQDVKNLEEVVVVGYGTVKKRDLTGAISTISSQQIGQIPNATVANILQGRAAGVDVVSNSGEPGGGITVRIRGVSTLNSGSEPLYIVDGVPIQTEALTKLNNGGTSMNPLADIDPNDIQSIEILKDAASGAIYGSRAANGVVLITTKRGKSGKPTISFNATHSVNWVSNKLDVLNAAEYRALQRDEMINGLSDGMVNDSLSFKNSGDIDAQKELFRTAHTQKYDLRILGGTEKLRYSLGANYYDQDGIVIESWLKRLATRANVDYQVSDKFKIGSNFSYSYSTAKRTSQGDMSTVGGAATYVPLWAIVAPDGSYYASTGGRANPVGYAHMIKNNNATHHLVGNEFIEWQILPGLTAKSSISLDYNNLEEDLFKDKAIDRSTYHSSIYSEGKYISWLNENILAYAKTFGKHHLSVIGGATFQKWNSFSTYIDATGYKSDIITTINAASKYNTVSTFESAHSLESVLGRVNYDFDGRYLLAGTLRRDGSSRFGKKNRWGNFPSLQFGWKFSAERFMQWAKNVLTEGKIRYGYGTTGNESIGDYKWLGGYGVGYIYNGETGIAPESLYNPQLKWETSKSQNVGLDLWFFDQRLELSSDYYIKTTDGLLFEASIPSTSGFRSFTTNLGKLENRGFEIQATVRPIMTSKFQWLINGNIATNKSKVLELPNSKDIYRGVSVVREGEQVGSFYGYIMDGVFSTSADNKFYPKGHALEGQQVTDKNYTGPTVSLTHGQSGPAFKGGDVRFRDLNLDGVIDEKDRTVIGHATPKFFGGLSTSLVYGNFTLSVYLNFVSGNDIYNGLRAARESMSGVSNASRATLNRWRHEGDVTDMPAAIYGDPRLNARASSRWVEDGSYVKFRNISLQYQLPSSIAQKMKFSRAYIFLQGENLLTFTKYRGYDPEINMSDTNLEAGVDYGGYPSTKGFNFGLNVEF